MKHPSPRGCGCGDRLAASNSYSLGPLHNTYTVAQGYIWGVCMYMWEVHCGIPDKLLGSVHILTKFDGAKWAPGMNGFLEWMYGANWAPWVVLTYTHTQYLRHSVVDYLHLQCKVTLTERVELQQTRQDKMPQFWPIWQKGYSVACMHREDITCAGMQHYNLSASWVKLGHHTNMKHAEIWLLLRP